MTGPTPAQLAYLKAATEATSAGTFIGGDLGRIGTRRICERLGWIEYRGVEYFKVTPAGRAIVEAAG